MKRLATPELREISSIETPSQPFSRNSRVAVARRLRCRRSASPCVGRPPRPRLNAPCSKGSVSMRKIPHYKHKDIIYNAMISFRYNRSSQVTSQVRRYFFILIAILGLAGAGWWWARARAPVPVAWQGYAEADFVKVGPTQQGLLTSVSVARGDKVAAGAPLFDQDDTADRAAIDQAKRQLAQSQEQLKNLGDGGKPTEIRQAQANLADAQAARDRAQEDVQRSEALLNLKSGAVSLQTLD